MASQTQTTVFLEAFARGAVPASMEGFYRGELTEVFPRSFQEHMVALLLNIWLPWKGKCFYPQVPMGDNILPLYLQKLFLMKYKDVYDFRAGFDGFHALPFNISVQIGLENQMQVLRLDYNLAQNPAMVRTVVDELVEVDGAYFGKAYIVSGPSFRKLAHFKLFK